MTCKYRLVKILYPDISKTFYWIQYPVKVFGIVMWWNTTTDDPYESEKSVMDDLQLLCGHDYYHKRTLWVKENKH